VGVPPPAPPHAAPPPLQAPRAGAGAGAAAPPAPAPPAAGDDFEAAMGGPGAGNREPLFWFLLKLLFSVYVFSANAGWQRKLVIYASAALSLLHYFGLLGVLWNRVPVLRVRDMLGVRRCLPLAADACVMLHSTHPMPRHPSTQARLARGLVPRHPSPGTPTPRRWCPPGTGCCFTSSTISWHHCSPMASCPSPCLSKSAACGCPKCPALHGWWVRACMRVSARNGGMVRVHWGQETRCVGFDSIRAFGRGVARVLGEGGSAMGQRDPGWQRREC
jgi:hypothetical protein